MTRSRVNGLFVGIELDIEATIPVVCDCPEEPPVILVSQEILLNSTPLQQGFGNLLPEDVAQIPALVSPIPITHDAIVLPEQTLLVLPMASPIQPGSGQVWGMALFQALMDDGSTASPVSFGRAYVYREIAYGGMCCQD